MWFLTALMACRPTIHMKVTVPAEVSINSTITKIAIVDRVDSEYSKKAIGGFLNIAQSADTVRFQIVDAQQIYEDLAVPVNGPISNESMTTLCEKAKVKGALVLHRFKNNSDMDVDKSTRAVTEDGKVKEYVIYTAEYSSDLQADWRFRGCNGETYDSYVSLNNGNWSAEGDTPGDAKSNLGDPKDLDIELADELGESYFRRVAPNEEAVYRTPYAGPLRPKGKRFRAAVSLMKEGKWHKAKKMFVNNMDGFTGKLEGKAYYDLAIIHENLGDFEQMVNYVKKADGILHSRKTEGYLEIAKKRRSAERKLQEQMKKAEDVNSQDNH
jgi:hypothetical protein